MPDHAATVKEEVGRLLKDMLAASQNQPEAMRQSILIAASIPKYLLEIEEVTDQPSLIPLRAQAIVARVWRDSFALERVA